MPIKCPRGGCPLYFVSIQDARKHVEEDHRDGQEVRVDE